MIPDSVLVGIDKLHLTFCMPHKFEQLTEQFPHKFDQYGEIKSFQQMSYPCPSSCMTLHSTIQQDSHHDKKKYFVSERFMPVPEAFQEEFNTQCELLQLQEILDNCLPYLNISQFKRKVDNRKHFRVRYELVGSYKDVLMTYYTRPKAEYCSRGAYSMLQINGLAFYPCPVITRPFKMDLQTLAIGALKLNAGVSALDYYLDDLAGITPVEEIHKMCRPRSYRRYIKSLLVRDQNKRPAAPYAVGSTLYFGTVPKPKKGDQAPPKPSKTRNGLCFYHKHFDPAHNIFTEGNPLDFSWIRWEPRLRGKTSQTIGMTLLQALSVDPSSAGALLVAHLRKYFTWVEPSGKKRVSDCLPQAWWDELLEKATYNNIPHLVINTPPALVP